MTLHARRWIVQSFRRDLKVRSELVLLHDDNIERPAGTGAWLDARQVATHHHVRLAQ